MVRHVEFDAAAAVTSVTLYSHLERAAAAVPRAGSLIPLTLIAVVVIAVALGLARYLYQPSDPRTLDVDSAPSTSAVEEHGASTMPPEPLVEVPSASTWSTDYAYSIGHTKDDRGHGIVDFLDSEKYPSVQTAVDALNAGTIACPKGICVVRSERQKLYFLVARSDKRHECANIARDVFNVKNVGQPLPDNGAVGENGAGVDGSGP